MSLSTMDVALRPWEVRELEGDESVVDFQIGAAAADIDADEIGSVVIDNFELIADCIAGEDALALGNLILQLRRQRIADIASFRMFGKHGLVKASQVTV